MQSFRLFEQRFGEVCGLLLITVIVLLFWGWSERQPESVAPPGKQQERLPDYWIEGLEALSTDAQGHLAYRLSAASMTPLRDTRGAKLLSARLELLSPPEPPWVLQARHAQIDADSRVITLYDGVSARQTGPDGLLTCVWGQQARIYPDTRYAEIESRVRLSRGKMELSAAGAQLLLRQGRIDLRGPVHGHYPVPGNVAAAPVCQL